MEDMTVARCAATANIKETRMQKVVSEIIINTEPGQDGILANSAVIVRVRDDGGGPYLSVIGRNLYPDPAEDSPNEFYLLTHKDIDDLFVELHEMLRQAEVADGGKGQ